MPIKFHKLQGDTVPLTFRYGGEDVNIVFLPGKFTPQVESLLQQAMAEQRPAGGTAEALSHILVSWDVLDEEGAPLPVSLELLQKMPVPFLNEIATVIGEHMRPNGTSGAS